MLVARSVERTGRQVSRPTGFAAPSGDDAAAVDLKELVGILKRQRRAILRVAAIPVLVALAYGVLATPLYTATTQILIDPRDRRILSNEVTPEGLAADGGVAVIESELLVLTSDSVLRRAIAAERLRFDPEFGASRNVLTLLLGDRTDPELKALRELKRKIGVKRSDKAFVADLFVSTEEREKSVRIANAIAQAYLDERAAARAASARDASEALTGRLEALGARLRTAEERVAKFKRDHNIIDAGGMLVNEQKLKEINSQLNNARNRTGEARARYEQIERFRRSGGQIDAIAEALQSQTISQLRVQYAELVRLQADQRARLGPRHPDVITLEAQAARRRRSINEELNRIAAAARGDYDRARASEATLEQSFQHWSKIAVSTNSAFVQLRELEREVEASRAVYQAFLVRARETGEQQSIDATNARVISTAVPPQNKSWPPRLLLLAIAIFAGLGFGTGYGLLREYFDGSVHSRAQLRDLLAMPVLAVLPRITDAQDNQRPQGGLWRWLRRRFSAKTDAIDRAPPFDISVGQLHSALLERGCLQNGRCMLISSTTAEEGKTSVAIHLALAVAAKGRHVLLIDADLDSGELSEALGTRRMAGLSELIEGRRKFDRLLQHDENSGIYLLPVGNVHTDDSLRSRPELVARRLSDALDTFDAVIVDSGSVMTDDYVSVFAEFADDIVFLVRAHSTNGHDARKAVDLLQSAGRKVRGTVLTCASVDGA